MFQEAKTELVNFSNLAGEAGKARREELTRHVATLFVLTSDRCSDEQVDIYDSVLSRLVSMVEGEVRAFVAGQLAGLRRAPEETVRMLVEDTIDIAEPLLVRSTALRDTDLIRVARSKGNEHLYAIAQRDLLSSDVTDVLVQRGDIVVKRRVAGNTGASFSGDGMDRLVLEAQADATLQAFLSERPDLADRHIQALTRIAGEEVRRKLSLKGEVIEASRLNEARRQAEQRMSNQFWLKRYDFETARGRVLALSKKAPITEAVLLQFAREDRFAEVVACFAWMARCGIQEASHWMVRPDPQPFLVVAKATGFSASTIGLLLMTGPWKHRLGQKLRALAMRKYEALSPKEAAAMVAHWSGASLN
ncbi:DUF2336 domain-containing protein [Roseibium sediminis]|uniref:DUF2336 domain-containing protein n=1 Tax=Roseibium sediminis TaxID=1775174 RepID=UPI00123E44AC|nr:DUF2336 domain-containing protein [Roseibium sediminis]